jgi:hypothetical protein
MAEEELQASWLRRIRYGRLLASFLMESVLT